MSGGAFLTSREIFTNPIWQNIVEFRLFFLIYGNATFTDGVRVGDLELKRGQWVRSIRNIQKDLEYIENRAVKNYALSTLKRAIDNLVKQKRVTAEVSELGTLFTVLNYQQYQGFDGYKSDNLERRENADGTQMEQRRNNNKKDINAMNGINDLKDIKDIVLFLNQKTGKKYSDKTEATKKAINARLKDGFTVDDFKTVIEIKTAEWLNDPKMNKYLCPDTLFRPGNFEKYLNQGVAKNEINRGSAENPYAGIDFGF
jgi:uncharacterized phage protein (TIGR02220 family)